jgi:predicted NAD-dependent protein-ADP-ribosyltransferase YbiA (DUF1768 family)
MANPYDGAADLAISDFFADPYGGSGDDVDAAVLTERDPARGNAELFGRGLEAGVSGMRASGNYFGAIASTLMGDDEGVQESLKQAERHDREAADALSGLQTFEGFLEAPTFESGIEQFMIAGGQGIPSLATTITASIATGGTAMLTGMLGRGVIDVGRKAAVKKVIKNSADKVADGTADAAERELVEGIYGGLKNLNFKSGAIAGGLTAGFVPLSGENLSEGIESGREVDTDLAIRSLFVAAPQAALELASPAAMLKNFSKVAAKTADASDGILSTLLKETLAGAGKGFATEAITEAGQETISVLNRADMDPNFEFEDGYMRIAQAAFQGGVAGKIAGSAGGVMAGSAKAANSIFDQAKQRIEESREQRIADQIDDEDNGPPTTPDDTPPTDMGPTEPGTGDLFDPENAPYEPTARERADIDATKVAFKKERQERAEAAEKVKRRKRSEQAKKNFTPKDEDGFLAAIAARGGLARSGYDIDNNDFADYYKTRVGSKFVFRKTGGLELDTMGEQLFEAGFYNERPSANQLLEDLDSALRSDVPYYTSSVGPDEVFLEQMADDYYANYYTEEDQAADQQEEYNRLAQDQDRRGFEQGLLVQRNMETFTPTDGEPMSDADAAQEVLRAIRDGERRYTPQESSVSDEAATVTRRGPKPPKQQGGRSIRKKMVQQYSPSAKKNQAQFREKMATAFESLAAKNPNDQRIQNLATRYVTGNQSVRDGILATMFDAPQERSSRGLNDSLFTKIKERAQQEPDNSQLQEYAKRVENMSPEQRANFLDRLNFETQGELNDDAATDEQIAEFFKDSGFEEVTQEYPVTENSVKADPTRVFPNTEEARDAYEKAFGDTDWTDPTYAYMTEAFLRQAADAKQEFGDVDLQIDRDLLGKPTAYRLTRTDFKRDEQAPNKEFVEEELKLAMSSTFADASGAEIVLPTGEVAPINLVNLTDSGRRLLQKRGDLTFQGGAQQQMARKGLPEFLSELSQIDERYDIRVNGVSIMKSRLQFGLDNKKPVKSQIGKDGTLTRDVVGAKAYGKDVLAEDVLQPPSEDTSRSRAFVLTYPDETKGEFKTEYKRYDDLRSAKQAAARAKANGRSAEAFLKPKGPVYVVTGKRLVKQPIKREPPVNVFYGSGENASLSNLAARPFAYGERDYLTVEHAYQTLKGGSFDQKTYDAYNRLPDATGKKITGPRAVTKDNANITLMEELMKASFEQNADAAKALTDTGQAGITHTQDRGVWKKEFPRILTDIRKSLRPSEGTRGSSTQVKSGDAPAPQSGLASNAEESMGRQQATAQYNADSLRMEQDRAKQEFSNEQNVNQTFFNPEEADAYAARLKNEFGFDNVRVEQVGMQLEPKSESDPDAVTGDESSLQQGDYNIDPDTGKRLYDGVPMTTLNLESNPKFQMDRRSALPRRAPRPQTGAGKKVGAATAIYPVGALSDTVSQAIGRAMRVIRPSKPVAIMGVKEILAKTDVELREMFDHPAVIADVKRQAERMKGRPTAFGHYMGYRNAHMILIDNTKGNELQQALVASHELGHVLFQEEKDGILENPMLRQYMWRAFERARANKDAPEAYRGEENLAFEEWFADQVAIWSKRDLARKEARSQPRGIIQRMFGKIAGKLEQMWKAVRGELRKRFSNNEFSPKFDDFMDNVVQKHRRNSERDGSVSNVPFYTKKLVRDMEAAMSDKQKEGAEKATNLFQKILFGNKSRELTKWILAEDNMMRAISPKIADMFYVQAGSTNKGSALGFLNAKNDKRNELLNDLEDILGTDWETQEVKDALDLASSDAETATMEGKGRELRDWFTKLHEDYISQSPGNEVGFRENYWPIALDLAGIYGAPEEFIQTILQWNPEANEASIRKTVDGLVAQRAHILADGEIEFDATNPLKVVEEARILTENVPPQALRKFTESPEVALIRYVRHQVIRNEFLRHTRNIDGKDLLEPELNKLNAADRQKVTDMIERYLGYTKTPLNPKLQKVNSYFQLFNWVTLLPLATISSIPEMGGAILNTREFNGFGMSLEAIKKQLNNREQGVQLARSIGVTVSTAMGNLGLTQADDEYLDPRVRQYSDKFFKAIGLDFFTRFTREFASGMAVEFLKNHASPDTKNPRSERYLSMHGVDAATVRKWESNQVEGEHYNFQGPEGEAVKAALRRFVENSMLRPNAAERTAYGNDPRFALVWALKSYLYSFGKVIMGGIAREMVTRYGEADTKFQAMSSIGMMGLLSAAAFMPLAMFSLELRELAKAGIAGALPGVSADARYFRSDRMDIGTYTSEIFDRAGFQGPLSIFSSALNADKYGGTGISLFGPTAGFIVDDIGMGLYKGEGWEIVPDRLIPGYSLVY